MTKRERKKAQLETQRTYKAARELYLAFRQCYRNSLLSAVQPLPSVYDDLKTELIRRKQLQTLHKQGKEQEMADLVERMSYHVGCCKSTLQSTELEMRAIISERRKATSGLPSYPTVQTLMKDLNALQGDFIKWEYSGRKRTVMVRTEPLLLKHPEQNFSVQFNEFDITLYLDALAEDVASYNVYTITSPRPVHPTRGGENGFIHPHVRADRLCEGAGAEAAQLFLRRGLLQDFFVLINQILSTYNPESPHFKLAYWTDDDCEGDMEREEDDDDGYDCAYCGDRVTQDNATSCDDCGDAVCERHAMWCNSGDRSICTSCVEDRIRVHRACSGCEKAGNGDCPLWTNPECDECNDIPTDDQLLKCECDSSITFCRDCADVIVADSPSWCDECDDIGQPGCALVAAGLPTYDDVVPASCSDDGWKAYRDCSVKSGRITLPETANEQEQETTKEEGTEDGREPEGSPVATAVSSRS